MLFRKKELPEICRDCPKVLEPNQKIIGICIACAQSQRSSILRSYKIKTIIGLLLVSVFLGILFSLSANNFDNIITNLPINTRITIVIICLMLPFGQLVSLEHALGGSRTVFIDENRNEVVAGESFLLVATEFLMFFITGPFFFLHGIYTMIKLSNYIKNT